MSRSVRIVAVMQDCISLIRASGDFRYREVPWFGNGGPLAERQVIPVPPPGTHDARAVGREGLMLATKVPFNHDGF